MTRLRFVVLTLAMLLGLGIVANAQNAGDNGPLGTWVVTVTPPAASGIPAFATIYTFASGGALIVTSQIDHLVPNVGLQQGSWRRGDHGEINSTLLAFLYDPTGTAVGMLKIRATYDFSVSGTFTGRGQQAFCDLNGGNCAWLPGSATLTGKLVEVEEPAEP